MKTLFHTEIDDFSSPFFPFIKLVLMMFVLIVTENCFTQNATSKTVNFSYDANGNRIHRWVTILKIAPTDSIDSIHQDSLIKNNITNLHYSSTQKISIFPNPTQGLLDLKITGMKDGETAEYVFVSLTGQELLRKKTGSAITPIDIRSFAPGTYIVNILVGEKREIWKIIKQ